MAIGMSMMHSMPFSRARAFTTFVAASAAVVVVCPADPGGNPSFCSITCHSLLQPSMPLESSPKYTVMLEQIAVLGEMLARCCS